MFYKILQYLVTLLLTHEHRLEQPRGKDQTQNVVYFNIRTHPFHKVEITQGKCVDIANSKKDGIFGQGIQHDVRVFLGKMVFGTVVEGDIGQQCGADNQHAQ